MTYLKEGKKTTGEREWRERERAKKIKELKEIESERRKKTMVN